MSRALSATGLQHALWREAIALVEHGICDAETVDTVIKAAFGRRLAVLGPLENADLVGTDLTLAIHKTVLPEIESRPGPSPYLEKLVADGKLGFKSGEGFRNLDAGAAEGIACQGHAPSESGARARPIARPMTMAIDFHAHLVDPQVYAETKAWSIFAQTQDAARAASVMARMADLDERIAAMDRMGVAIQVLSSSLVHQCTYDAEPAEALRLDRRMNDRIARAVASKPDRFRGLGSVPLQSPELAVQELTRCMGELGLSGVTISTTRTRPGNRRCRAAAVLGQAAEAARRRHLHPSGRQS